LAGGNNVICQLRLLAIAKKSSCSCDLNNGPMATFEVYDRTMKGKAMPRGMHVTLITGTLILFTTVAVAQVSATGATEPSANAPPAQVFPQQDMKDAVGGAKPDIESFFKVPRGFNVVGMHLNFSMLRRHKVESSGLVHDRITEIYEIQEGGGTLLTGGQLLNAQTLVDRPESMTGPSRKGTQIVGGISQHVGAGDMVIIPAGTPHEFTGVDGDVAYLIIRLDPSH
jgi:hypothetical protein